MNYHRSVLRRQDDVIGDKLMTESKEKYMYLGRVFVIYYRVKIESLVDLLYY